MNRDDGTNDIRIDRWRQQLLDLSLRNRLLNFRETKQTVPIICHDAGMLEDTIAARTPMKILPASNLMSEQDPRDSNLLLRSESGDVLRQHLEDELAARRLRSSLEEQELAKRLLTVYRRTRMEMEESGANTLFLACGFLEWQDQKSASTSHRAPLLLVPVMLQRKSVIEGFTLEREDEDSLVNVTLLELLKRDFGKIIPGVDPPPEDEFGVDVERVLSLFEEAVQDMTGWKVHREVWLGRFSFNKFLLWKDLSDRLDCLLKNDVVKHLVYKAGEPFFDGVDDVLPEALDQTVEPSELYCPLSADSSQLAAVIAAAAGKNFVLYGPPGTGKSQTIANLITHALACGKSVLFVAEKRAALEVVHRRLSTIGLKPFCLELHSNKTGKADVLAQFGEALDFGMGRTPSQWKRVAGTLKKTRDQLNAFVDDLHEPGPGGFSAYQSFVFLMTHQDKGAESLGGLLTFSEVEKIDRARYEELCEMCSQLERRHGRLEPALFDALQAIGHTEWRPDWQDQAVARTRRLLEVNTQLEKAFSAACAALHLDIEPTGEQVINAMALLSAALLDMPSLPSAFMTGGDWAAFAKDATAWIAMGRTRDEAKTALADFELAAVRGMKLDALEETFQALRDKHGFFARIRRLFFVRKFKKARKKSAPKFRWEQVGTVLDQAKTLLEAEQFLDRVRAEAVNRFGALWKEEDAAWQTLDDVVGAGERIHAALLHVAGTDFQLLDDLCRRVAALLEHAADFLKREGAVGAVLVAFADCRTVFQEAKQAFMDCLTVTDNAWLQGAFYFQQVQALCDAAIRHQPDLRDWCSWQQIKQQAIAAELGPMVDLLDHTLPSESGLRDRFEAAFRDVCIRKRLSDSAPLRDFWSDSHEDLIARFQQLDDEYMTLAAQTAVARIASELPRARNRDCPRNSELGIVQRERAKRSRHKPVRRLIQEIPSILPKLKPCFLMSPLSVAQYLDASQELFDMVVFDEASQIPVWDAVGAIARGTQVVVVGDPKQLPPTNFFARAESDEFATDDDFVDDLESILDECIGAGLPAYYLQWHYRSRNEELIAFSNYHYYESKLLTFPQAHAGTKGVRLVPVPDGCYDKGNTRTNRAEAAAVVQEVVRRLTDELLCEKSIGVVTFSQAQQELVEDLLEEARREHPEIEPYFDGERDEPVFVKNLENVQGDERDIILFSVCYAADSAGKLSMNFGPLNRDGGERRLNVAVTRARREVLLFSTLKAEQIDLARTRAVGVAHLKSYLEFAERGMAALGGNTDTAERTASHAPFAEEVANCLRQAGYDIRTQIGCSGYRIDLAVVDPESPGDYLVGIECDGATYHQAATARDRDRLRQLVLNGLGWTMIRAWSTDWWRNKEKAARALLDTIEQVMQKKKQGDEHTDAPAEENPSTPEETTNADEADAGFVPAENRFAAPYPNISRKHYKSQDAFFSRPTMVQRRLTEIINHEGPIMQQVLIRRVVDDWDFSRETERIQNMVCSNIAATHRQTLSSGEPVYWPEGIEPEAYETYRIPNADPEQEPFKRTITDIPHEELKNALRHQINDFISIPQDDLFRLTAKLFGLRLTSKTRDVLDVVFEQIPDLVILDGIVSTTKQP